MDTIGRSGWTDALSSVGWMDALSMGEWMNEPNRVVRSG